LSNSRGNFFHIQNDDPVPMAHHRKFCIFGAAHGTPLEVDSAGTVKWMDNLMGLARQDQGARRKRCRYRSLTTSNANIASQAPWIQWIPAAGGHLSRCRSSTIYIDIACVTPPGIYPGQARNPVPPTRKGSWENRNEAEDLNKNTW